MPFIAHLLREVGGQLADALGLLGIQQITSLQVANGTAADVLFDRQMQHAVDQSFAQCAAGQHHAFDAQLLENRQQDRQPAWEHQSPLQRQPFNFQLFQLAALNGALFQLAQFGQGDAFIHALCHHDFLQRLDGAGSTNADLPTVLTQLWRDGTHHFTCSLFGPLEILQPQITIAEEPLQPGDTTHRQAVQLSRLCAGTGNQLGATAADIDH
ncbi:hypothetical protein D3C78_1007820 [compost metagenome]